MTDELAPDDELQPLYSKLEALLAQLTPAARAALARDIARNLRGSQARRIGAQQNPDGTPYEPRKPQKVAKAKKAKSPGKSSKGKLRKKKGKLRAAMFVRMKMARTMKARSNASEAVVTFLGRAAKVASTHQYGLRDRVNRHGTVTAKYPKRELLGITDAEQNAIETAIVNHLGR